MFTNRNQSEGKMFFHAVCSFPGAHTMQLQQNHQMPAFYSCFTLYRYSVQNSIGWPSPSFHASPSSTLFFSISHYGNKLNFIRNEAPKGLVIFKPYFSVLFLPSGTPMILCEEDCQDIIFLKEQCNLENVIMTTKLSTIILLNKTIQEFNCSDPLTYLIPGVPVDNTTCSSEMLC